MSNILTQNWFRITVTFCAGSSRRRARPGDEINGQRTFDFLEKHLQWPKR